MLLEIPRARHSLLDTRSQVAQIALRWSAAGAASLLPQHAAALATLPAAPVDLALSKGLQLALAAERLSPWRLRRESARALREDPRTVTPDANRSVPRPADLP